MKLNAILLLCLLTQACQTQKPELKRTTETIQIPEVECQSKLKRKMETIVIPEVDFRQADVADVIAFIVEAPRDKRSGVPTLGLGEAKREDLEYDRKYFKLKQYCAGKTITLNLRYCSLLNLLEFVIQNYTDIEYEFEGDNIIIRTHDGLVLVDDQTGEPSVGGDGKPAPQP